MAPPTAAGDSEVLAWGGDDQPTRWMMPRCSKSTHIKLHSAT
jgi:hypothetical protein